MANPFHYSSHLLFLIIFFSIQNSSQLQFSQSQALLNIQQLLNYPLALSTWSEVTDFCNTEPNQSITIVCYEDSITQLHIFGNNGLSETPHSFSTETFFTNLADLPTLKVLSLVSLGLWGPLPNSIGTLSSLEILNLSSNYFNGSIPMEVLSLRSLQTLVLDHNMFTGEVPYWLSSLPMLTVLSFVNNSLSGPLPNSLSSMDTLRILRVSRNHLFGEVPNLCNLTNLQTLDLEENSFGPDFPSLSTKLMTLVIRKNRFKFGLPGNLSAYYQLQKMDISLNEFEGPFSPALLSLPSLTYLDIAENNLIGRLFRNMSCNAGLSFVNLSSNRLTGSLPACLEWGLVVQSGGNCLSNSSERQHPYLYCHNEALAVKITPREGPKRPVHKRVLAASLVGGLVGGIALSGLVFLFTRGVSAASTIATCQKQILEKVSPAYTMKLLSDARYISETMKLGALGLPPYRTFVLEELKEATNNFSTSNLISEGSYGQVYKGLLTDGTAIAVRSLKMQKRHSIHRYTHQIELISKLRHCHLACAIGHCFECYPDDSSVSKIFLVFEYVPNGTLRGCISERLSGQNFSWTQRIAAVIGVTKGIQFLHTGTVPGVFSNNLKITDVFMDQNLHVKISCYNLPLLSEKKRQVGDAVSSTEPQENVQGSGTRHGDKNDVYDLGVILLEIILGRPIMSKNDIGVAKDLLQVSLTADKAARRSIVDPGVCKECSDESLRTAMEICVRCLSNVATDRPSVEDVLWNLQFAAQVQDSWRGDCKSNQGSPLMCSI